MKPIFVFYHCFLSGPNGERIAALQIDRMNAAGLLPAAAHVYVGGENARNELPTLMELRWWAKESPGCYFLYLHTKGASHEGLIWEAWRNCMERRLVDGWRQCVADLDAGADSVGTHWITGDKYPDFKAREPFWGGNFWWAKSEYLATLPEIKGDEDRYYAEDWIGKGPAWPRVVNYEDHFPLYCR